MTFVTPSRAASFGFVVNLYLAHSRVCLGFPKRLEEVRKCGRKC